MLRIEMDQKSVVREDHRFDEVGDCFLVRFLFSARG